MQLAGRTIDPTQDKWLQSPGGMNYFVGAEFFERLAKERGYYIKENTGLLRSFSQLEGGKLNLEDIDQKVKDFYEKTAEYRLTVWPDWNFLVKPFAQLFIHSFCRKIQQFNLPLSIHDTCHGVTNRVFELVDPDSNKLIHAVWVRCNAKTAIPMYVSSFSSISRIPGCPYPCVKVVFPISQGSATVFLEPASKGGKLVLSSQGRNFGDSGLYLTQETRSKYLRVIYLSLFLEHLEVFVDRHGQLRGYHLFKFWRLPILRLYYQFDCMS